MKFEGTVYAIDPGSMQSAWVRLVDEKPADWGIVKNYDLLSMCLEWSGTVIVERVESFGMRVGKDVFKTVWWTGRFHQAMFSKVDLHYLSRREVKLHLLYSIKGTDKMIKDCLIERFGHPGTKKSKGILYGIKKDEWQALAVAVTWIETQKLSLLNKDTFKDVQINSN